MTSFSSGLVRTPSLLTSYKWNTHFSLSSLDPFRRIDRPMAKSCNHNISSIQWQWTNVTLATTHFKVDDTSFPVIQRGENVVRITTQISWNISLTIIELATNLREDFTITEKAPTLAPTRDFSLLKEPLFAFTFLKAPVSYDLCVGIPISRLITVFRRLFSKVYW